MYNALDVSKYVIEYEHAKGRSISNLRLQKLLYFIQAEFLVNKKKPCFDDAIEAWTFGPVIPSVYHTYKFFGSSDIFQEEKEFRNLITDSDQNTINQILDSCAKYHTARLVSFTHQQAPWIDAYKFYKDSVIAPQAIQQFFAAK
jgi:uncharacterized phage-associated protein